MEELRGAVGRPALLGSFGQRQAACPSRGGQSWGSCWADWDPAWQPLHLEKPLCLLGPPLAGGFWPGSVCWCPDLGPQRLTATSAWGSGPTASPTLGRFCHLPALGSLAWKLGQGHSLPGPPQGPGEWGGSPRPSPDGVGRRARSHRQLRLNKLLGLTCLLHWKVKTEDVPGVVTARRDSEGFLRVAEVASSFYEKEP